MPTILRVGGHRFFFWSHEGNEPPHIHVETAENYAKFWLNPVSLAQSSGYNARELRQLHDLVIEHRELFEEAWYEHFS
ncbi:MAG: DUF4160 domain-containing protein [Anaerolineae bacterium]|nr:DUF4160 domain-containing protein [Anaerolineae bacterium]